MLCLFNPASTPFFPLVSALLLAKKLFKQFIQTCIKNVRGQVLPLLLIKSLEKALDRLFKAKNLHLYHENLYMECYYFCR